MIKAQPAPSTHQATDHPSTPVSYWQHSGLLKELGLLCYTMWCLWHYNHWALC